jgi:hypothetical protein
VRSSDWVEAAEADEIDSAMYVDAHQLFLLRIEKRILALSAVSPHRPEIGKRLLYCPSGYFIGPHGELFDAWGAWVDGPSPRGMDTFETRVRYGTVEVNVGTPMKDRRVTTPRCSGWT